MPQAPRRAWKLPAVLFLGAAAAVLVNLPQRTYGDDVFFVWCIVRDRIFVAHFLFMPLARAWTFAAARLGVDPLLALRLLSAVAAAAGTALLAAAAARRGARPALACALALCVLTAGSTWFFAGAAEIHAVHLAAFGLLAWTLAGLRADSSPWRVFALALCFGVAVGAHRTSGLLLPAVLVAYPLATQGRSRALRLYDAGAFTLGGLLSLAAMLGVQLAETGSALSEHDRGGYWLDGLRAQLRRGLGPRDFADYLGTDWVAPAFALALLGAFAAGALLRRERRAGAALVVALLPHALFFPVFRYAERGAYYIVTLPILTWAVARAALARAPGSAASAEPTPRVARVVAVLVVALAAAGAVLRSSELLQLAGAPALCALAAAAFVAGLGAPPPRISSSALALGGLGLAALQWVGAERELRAWDHGTPLLDWGRDAVLATGHASAAGPGGEEPVLIAAGFQEYMLLLLLGRPWREPYEGTWDYAAELGTLGPIPFDVGYVAPMLESGVEDFLAEKRRVFVLDSVFQHFELDPLRGAHVRALRERYDLVPVRRGSFSAFEIVRRAGS